MSFARSLHLLGLIKNLKVVGGDGGGDKQQITVISSKDFRNYPSDSPMCSK